MRFLALLSLVVPSLGWAQAQFEPDSYFDVKIQTGLETTLCRTSQGAPYPENQLIVCKAAVDAASKMAPQYAKPLGEYLGCVDAMVQGIGRGFKDSSIPDDLVLRLAKTKYENLTIQKASDDAKLKAKGESQSKAEKDVIVLHREHIGHNGIPEEKKTPQPDIEPWIGYDDGIKYFEVPYQEQLLSGNWIRIADSIESKLSAGAVYAYQIQPEYSASDLCDNHGTLFEADGYKQAQLRDYFQAKNPARSYKTKYGERVFNLFKEQPKAAGRGTYDSIKLMKEDFVTVVGNETKVVKKTVDQPRIDFLRGVFRNKFIEAYDNYYARVEILNGYKPKGDLNFPHALQIGEQLGFEYARAMADARAYANRYQEVSRDAYLSEAKLQYNKKFNETMEKFATRMILEMVGTPEIINTSGNHSLLRGDEFKVRFGFNNLGQVGGYMITSIDPVITPVITESFIEKLDNDFFEIPALSSLDSYTTAKAIGRVKNTDKIPINQEISFRVKISDGATTSNGYTVSARETSFYVQTMANIDNAKAKPQLFTAKSPHYSRVDLTVYLSDPTFASKSSTNGETVTTPVRLKITIDGYETFDYEAKLENGKATVYIPYENIDTLRLIKDHGVTGKVESYVGNQFATSFKFSKGLDVIDEKINTVAYFGKIAREGDGVRTFEDFGNLDEMPELPKSFNDRMEQIHKKILEFLLKDIANINWKNPHSVSDTIVHLLQVERGASQSEFGQSRYDALAEKMAQNVGRIRKKSWKKAYLKELRLISPKVNLDPKYYEQLLSE